MPKLAPGKRRGGGGGGRISGSGPTHPFNSLAFTGDGGESPAFDSSAYEGSAKRMRSSSFAKRPVCTEPMST